MVQGNGVSLLRGRSTKPIEVIANEKPILTNDKVEAIKEAKRRYKNTPKLLKPLISDTQADEIITNKVMASPDDKLIFELSKKERDSRLQEASLSDIQYEDNHAQVLLTDKRDYANFKQDKVGKVASIVDKITKGESVSQDDFNYFSSQAPKAKDELIAEASQFVNINGEHPQEGLVNYYKGKNRELTKKYYNENLDKTIKALQGSGIDVSKISDVNYQTQVTESTKKLYEDRKKEIEAKYPYKQRKEDGLVSVRGVVHPQFNERDAKFNEEMGELESDYNQIQNTIGYAVATEYALKNPNATPEQIGLEHLRVSNPKRYKEFRIGGSISPTIKAEIARYGIQALKSTNNDNSIALAEQDEKSFNDKYPKDKSNEIYHRLGAELYKQNYFGKPSIQQLDKIANTQFSQEDRDFLL
jgi:hypothetical protein